MKKKNILFAGVGVMVLFLLGTISASAQAQGAAKIQGTVKDPGGSATAGALVSLSGANMSSPRTATTDGSGRFTFDDLQPGTYTVNVQAVDPSHGSEPKNVNARAGKTTTVNIRLRRRE